MDTNIDSEFIGLMKTSNFAFDKLSVAKSGLLKLFHRFKKSDFTIFFILANIFFGVGMQCSCAIAFSRTEGGTQVLAGLAPSSLTVESSLTTPRPAWLDRKIWHKLYCIEGTEMRQLGFKVRRLLFLNRY